MQFYKEPAILEYFDVSIVMSFYKKLNDFKRVLPCNQKYLQRNGIEVIICLDEPDEEKDLLSFIQLYPFINWKIIVNRQQHAWRNHCKVLNVGIRNSSNKYILVLDPEVELFTDVIYQLRYMLFHYENSYATGQVAFVNYETEVTNDNIENFDLLPYGSIMMPRKVLEAIRGYNETYIEWGAEDDNIRRRLELYGLRKIFVPEAVALHREEVADNHANRYFKSSQLPNKLKSESFCPKQITLNNKNWGNDFNNMVYSWQNRKFKKAQLVNYLTQFDDYKIGYGNILNKDYKIIALLPVRNESAYLPEVLLHLDKYCDGIILLDDGSNDNSYGLANSKKLLLKVSRKYKGSFDDLENRNLLLQLGTFFNPQWFFFTDADEEFCTDPKYFKLLNQIKDADCIAFKLVHLWNSTNYYRRDVPEGENGILHRHRMFRNKGFMQINSTREIHFPSTPITRNSFRSNVLVKHYGLMTEKTRTLKYERYIKQDDNGEKQSYNYDYLLTMNPDLDLVENLNVNAIDINSSTTESKIIAIVPFFNSAPYIEECYQSIINQEYKNYEVYFIDDCSTDNPFDRIPCDNSAIKKITNSKRSYTLKNIYDAIVRCKANSEDIIVIIDGDDYLVHNHVFDYLNRIYRQKKCLISYGQYCGSNGLRGHCKAYGKDEFDNLRNIDWRASHLKNFKYKLYKEFIKQDPQASAYKDSNGEFYRMNYGIALMTPLLEIAGYENVYFNEEVFYYYRRHSFNDDIIDSGLQKKIGTWALNKKAFTRSLVT